MNCLTAIDTLSETLGRWYLPEWRGGETTLATPWGIGVSASFGAFYVIRSGECVLVLDASPTPVALIPGDVVLLARGSAHRLFDQITSPTVPFRERLSPTCRAPCYESNAAATTTLVHGHFASPPSGWNPFQVCLPALVRLSRDTCGALRGIEPLLELIAEERVTAKPGWQAIVDQLVRVLFVRGLRASLTNSEASAGSHDASKPTSWLRAAADPLIGPVLQLVHSQPQHPWTVTALARQANLSKSAFSERFRHVVGQSPLKYLTGCRMHKASELLRHTEVGVKQIASSVGYESVSSFSNAFRRWTGKAPAAFRRNGSL